MGHTRLGKIPRTRSWNEVVERVAGTGLASGVTLRRADMATIAAKTLEAARKTLDKAVDDSGVRYTFYLLTQVALASRTRDWEAELGRHDIRLAVESSLFDLITEVQAAIDRYVGRSPSAATDLSEIALQSAGEAILSLAGTQTASLFGGGRVVVQHAMRSLSTKRGFGKLGQRFYGRFLGRFLNFYLSRVTAAELGRQRLLHLGDVAQFNEALRSHCDQSACRLCIIQAT